MRGKEHDIKGVKVNIGQAVPKADPNKTQEFGGGYGGNSSYGYGGQSGFNPSFGGGGGASGGGFNRSFNSGAFSSGASGGFPSGPPSGFSNVPSPFGGGAGGFGSGPSSGFGGGFGGGNNTSQGMNFADIARWAIEMSIVGPPGGNNWNQPGGHMADNLRGNSAAKFSGRRSNERRF